MKLLKLENEALQTIANIDDAVPYEGWMEGEVATAIALPHDLDLANMALDLAEISRIDLTFPIYRDGRAFTQARLLRTRFGFTGEIRATGDVLRDQFLFMVRCGFNAFIIDAAQKVGGFVEALTEYQSFYQTSADAAIPVWHQRHSPALLREEALEGAA